MIFQYAAETLVFQGFQRLSLSFNCQRPDLIRHEEEYQLLKDKDKDWFTVKYGYFVLVSNIETTPVQLLSEYFSRVDIETVFKTSKEYLDILPLSKWTVQTVRGKILHDIISTIVLLMLRKSVDHAGISISELLGKIQSLMCFRNNSGLVTVETPCRQVKDYYQLLATDVPAHVKIDAFLNDVMNAKM